MFIKQIDRNELTETIASCCRYRRTQATLTYSFQCTDQKEQRRRQIHYYRFGNSDRSSTQGEFDGAESAITISAKKLQEILRAIPDNSSVSLDDQENKLLVKANKSRFSLQTLPAQDFPMLSEQLVGASKSRDRTRRTTPPIELSAIRHGTARHSLLPEWRVAGD